MAVLCWLVRVYRAVAECLARLHRRVPLPPASTPAVWQLLSRLAALYPAQPDLLPRHQLQDEIAWLQERLVSPASPLVFCHNVGLLQTNRFSP